MRPHLIEALSGIVGERAAHLLAPSYFMMAALATIVGAILAMRGARRAGLDERAVLAALTGAYVGAVVGGILFPFLLDLAGQLLAGRVPRPRWAGMVAYGGFFGGILGAYLGLRRRRTVTLGAFLDLIAAPLGLAIAIVRCGCFIAGCDYGEVTSGPWAVRFPAGSAAWHDHVRSGLVPSWRGESLPVHPTQLYEALFGVAIFVGATITARFARAKAAAGRDGAQGARPAGNMFLGVALAYA